MIRLKKMLFFSKIGLLSFILLLGTLNFADAASPNETLSDARYFLISNEKIVLADIPLSISAGDKIVFRIFDNSTKVFITNGAIRIGDETVKIEPHSITEELEDKFREVISSVFGGESTVGNNSEYYAEYTSKENPKAESYSVIAAGEYNSNSTKNTITIHIQSRYITKTVGSPGRVYEGALKNLSTRSLKYHKDSSMSADNLIKNINQFLEASNNLKKKILNLTENPDNNDLKRSLDNVTDSREQLELSIKEFENGIKDDKLLKNQSSTEIKLIKDNINSINSELLAIFIAKRDSLLKNELDAARRHEKTSSTQFESTKSDYISGVFNPAGALILLGIIIGFINVNRWKKESEYFGLYTSKAKITSPVTIAIILTVIILMLIGAVVYSMTGNFDMFINTFKFLI